MRNHPWILAVLVLAPSAAFAAQLEDTLTLVGKLPVYVLVAFAIVVSVWVYFMKVRDPRDAPLERLFEAREPIHSVPPDAPVADCVQKMSSERIGALTVMEGERLLGIFTERDALTRVLAAGRDPGATRVSEVMTRDPQCVSPGTSVRDAMQIVTARRFRHLPVVANGRVLAIISSGDLTHWLVKGQIGEVQELVSLAARS